MLGISFRFGLRGGSFWRLPGVAEDSVEVFENCAAWRRKSSSVAGTVPSSLGQGASRVPPSPPWPRSCDLVGVLFALEAEKRSFSKGKRLLALGLA